jgi:molybdate transport system ATP-binding protein
MTGGAPMLSVDFTSRRGAFSVTSRFEARVGITALYGPSGSGKSVTLLTIAGLIRPECGTVVLAGRALVDVARSVHVRTQDRGVGVVFQSAGLLPHRSPVDNVALAARGGTRSSRRSVAEQWLARVGASHLAHSPTTSLSGGEMQRVALARALVGEPSALLLDEPFSSLDRDARSSLRSLVRDLTRHSGLTVLLVTHDLEDLTDLADGVVMFEPGRTVGQHELRGEGRESKARLLGLD